MSAVLIGRVFAVNYKPMYIVMYKSTLFGLSVTKWREIMCPRKINKLLWLNWVKKIFGNEHELQQWAHRITNKR